MGALLFYFFKKGKMMKAIPKTTKQIQVGIYDSLKAASKQVDMLLKRNGDLCVNIVRHGSKFQVNTVVWQ
ncbi:hypothetical protein l13_10880 [Neisseria weaveri ATCC 51223]|nr:hypothetical protein l13_10880 [Neisseria weaveri ATCC 51223]